MTTLNPELLRFAKELTGLARPLVKQADPTAAMGAPGMDPAAMGMGPPPIDPTAAMPPGAGVPGGQPAPSPAPMPSQAPAAVSASGNGMGKKMKPEEVTMAYRMYNIMVMLTAIMNHLGITVPPEALLTPPGPDGVPIPEQAAPGSGSPVDVATQQQGQAAQQAQGGGQSSAIQPIDPIQGAVPSGEKQAAATVADEDSSLRMGFVSPSELDKAAEDSGPIFELPKSISPAYDDVVGIAETTSSAAAVAKMLRANCAG